MIALLSSILILYTLKWIKYIKSNTFYPINQLIYWFFINNFILLTYIGRQVIELFSIHNYQTNSIN
jgi:quinol-cytochrome oxidoreductase complex cytochrome b subunit